MSTKLTTEHSDAGIKSLAELYRSDKDDGPLTDKQKARLYLVQHCREVEVRKRKLAAKNAVQVDEASAK